MALGFEHAVDPILEQILSDPAYRLEVRTRMLGCALKVGLAMWGYAGAARVRFDVSLTALAGAYTRLYDDLMDDPERPGFDDRFRAGLPDEDSELEVLLIALLLEIARRLDRPAEDPVFAMVWRVHLYQLRSWRQRDPSVSDIEVADITLGKGGWGVATLCALLRPRMSEAEQRVVVRIGGLLQVLDDHYDLAVDAADGIATTATRRLYSFGELVEEAIAVRREIQTYYGSGCDRRMAAAMFAMLVIVPSLRIREWLRPTGRGRSHGVRAADAVSGEVSSARMLFLRRAYPIDVRGH
ncbi:MAG: hypothetical protein HOV83_40800 [Catenulispora sp.]|nr:hypothetical protein [Catenulispora sp.]